MKHRSAALLVLALLAVAYPSAAQTVRTTLKPESGIVIGQQVRILIDVLFEGAMPHPPRVSLPDMPGAQVVRFETQATTMNERIDGKDYVGQRFEFALYPRRGGMLEVPAPQVTLLDVASDETGRVAGQPARVEVTVPAGVDPSQPVIATTAFKLEEQWTPAPTTGFKAGDALVHTLRREAADVPGMAMLDLAFTAPPGVRIYVDPPQSDDAVDRGAVTGRRTDRVTYVFERSGSFTLPGARQPWWDLEARRLRVARTPEVTVSVVAAPVAASARLSTTDRLERWVFLAATLAGLVALVSWAGPRWRAWQRERHDRYEASEAKAFADLQVACRGGEAGAVYRAFVHWRQHVPLSPAAFAPLAEELETVLFASGQWSLAQARGFGARCAALRPKSHGNSRRQSALPPLNPIPT